MPRGSSNGNSRGGSKERAKRRQWLVDMYGDGVKVGCFNCDEILTVDTVTADRIKPGALGGTYRRDNIRACCNPCNMSLGGKLSAKLREAKTMKKGDEYECEGWRLLVTAVAKDKTWANVKIWNDYVLRSFRMPLPFPYELVRVK